MITYEETFPKLVIEFCCVRAGGVIENPFPKKIRDKDTMTKYLDADEKLSNTSLKIDYYDTMLVYLESILKVIQNRTFQIKNAIEFMRFNSGMG